MTFRSHHKTLDEAEKWVVLPSFVISRTPDVLVIHRTYREEIEVLTKIDGQVFCRILQDDSEVQDEGMSYDAYALWRTASRPDAFDLVARYMAIRKSGKLFFGCANIVSFQRRLAFLVSHLASLNYFKPTALDRLRAYVYFFSLNLEMEKIEGALANDRGLKKTPPGLVMDATFAAGGRT